MAGATDPVQIMGGLTSDPEKATTLAPLFPPTLADNGLPEGWVYERIGRHVTARKGLSYKGSGLTCEGNGIPLHNLNSIFEGGGYKDSGLKYYNGEFKERHTVRPGDLIVANTEQGFDHLLIGYSAIVPEWPGDFGLFSHHIYKVEVRKYSPLSVFWLHHSLCGSKIGVTIRGFSNGTTVNMLPPDSFELPEIAVPTAEVVREFDEMIIPVAEKRAQAVSESRTLAAMRDLLLPKLMSGEIRLRDAERAVGEAAA